MKPMPGWCTDCRGYFSVRTGTPIAHSNVPLYKWAIAIHLCLASLKSVSSMKLHRDIGVSQPTAWFMLHRIREAWAGGGDGSFDGSVEFDETRFGGSCKNMSNAERKELAGTGRGAVGKTAAVSSCTHKGKRDFLFGSDVIQSSKQREIEDAGPARSDGCGMGDHLAVAA